MRAVYVDILGPEDTQWTSFLSAHPHDVFHRPAYVSLEADWVHGKPMAIYARSGSSSFLVPLVLVRAPSLERDFWDAFTPYGYAGPIGDCGTVGASFDDLFDAVLDQCRRHRIVSLYARENPFCGLDASCEGQRHRVCDTGPVVYVDLERDTHEIYAAMRRNHRSDIASLLNNGFRAYVDNWSHWTGFVEMYLQTMRRVNSASYYRYDSGYLKRLREILGDAGHLITVCEPTGRVVAAVLATLYHGVCHVHLSATADHAVKESPAKLAIFEAISFARNAGAKVCNLGGGAGVQEDGLYRFKLGFSPTAHQIRSIQAIVNPDAYKRIEGEWYQRCPDVDAAPKFFPQYRACTRCRSPGKAVDSCALCKAGLRPAWCPGRTSRSSL